MQKLGKNLGSYLGETIDIHAVQCEVEVAAQQHGWDREVFYANSEFRLLALHRAGNGGQKVKRIYLSTGIHGDEPAGPLAALRLLQDDAWPGGLELWLCPCLNPIGFKLNTRANAKGIDLNRGYLNPVADEIRAHIVWLEKQPPFDVCLMLHEDWESHGFYLYEQNPDGRTSYAEAMIEAVEKVCPIDRSELIEGRPAQNGIVRPNIQPKDRPEWPEAFYLITKKTRQSYTLEAPSDFPLPARVSALVAAVNATLQRVCEPPPWR
ncbi:MAG: M14 family metallocarboxypeptidase [Limisphaerales bacterium]